jgi:hypothetical protein
MTRNFTTQELIAIGLSSVFLMSTLIALFDSESLNRFIIGIFTGIEKRYKDSTNWFTKTFFGLMRVPILLSSNVEHEGWKSGILIGTGTLSLLAFFGILYIMLWVFLFIIVVIILAIILMGGKRR